MKPAVAFFCVLSCSGMLFGNQARLGTSTSKPGSLLEELVQMTRAGSSDVELLAYAGAHRRELPSEVSDNDLRWLRDSGVSERVVSYMAAIDVRAPDDAMQEAAASPDRALRPRASYAYGNGDGGSYENGYPDGYVSSYSEGAAGDSDSNWGDYGWCPFCDYGFYPDTFFVYQPPFFDQFRTRDQRFHARHGLDRGLWRGRPRGVMNARGAPTETWRERGFSASARRPAALAPRAPARTVFARRGIGPTRGSANRASGRLGFGPSGRARVSFPSGFRAPQRSIGSRGSFGHPSFPGGSTRGAGAPRGGGMRH